jgi:hypothetical protein
MYNPDSDEEYNTMDEDFDRDTEYYFDKSDEYTDSGGEDYEYYTESPPEYDYVPDEIFYQEEYYKSLVDSDIAIPTPTEEDVLSSPGIFDVMLDKASLDDLLSFYNASKYFNYYLNTPEAIKILADRFDINTQQLDNREASPFMALIKIYDKNNLINRCSKKGIYRSCIFSAIRMNDRSTFARSLVQMHIKNNDLLYKILEEIINYGNYDLLQDFFDYVMNTNKIFLKYLNKSEKIVPILNKIIERGDIDMLKLINSHLFINIDRRGMILIRNKIIENNNIDMLNVINSILQIDWNDINIKSYDNMSPDFIHAILLLKGNNTPSDLIASIKTKDENLIDDILNKININPTDYGLIISIIDTALSYNNRKIIGKLFNKVPLREKDIIEIIRTAIQIIKKPTPDENIKNIKKFFEIFCIRYGTILTSWIYKMIDRARPFQPGEDDIIASLINCLYLDEETLYAVDQWLHRHISEISDSNWSTIRDYLTSVG